MNYDGFRHAFRAASLLSSDEVLSPSLLLRFEDALREVARLHANDEPSGAVQLEAHLIPLGCDETMETLFVFDSSSVAQGQDMEVVAWISGLGMRVARFEDLLELLADLTEMPVSRTRAIAAVPQAVVAA